MSPAALLAAVRAAGGNLALDGDRLRVTAPAPLPDPLVEALRASKSELLALLRGAVANDARPAGAEPVVPVEADPDERAAIVEHDGKVPEPWASGFARLAAMRPPSGIARARWLRMLDDAGAFLDAWGGEAVRLGWTTADVFGVNRHAPVTRTDGHGLVWVLDGRPVIAVSAMAATIRTPSGRALAYRRQPAEDVVPLWEMEAER